MSSIGMVAWSTSEARLRKQPCFHGQLVWFWTSISRSCTQPGMHWISSSIFLVRTARRILKPPLKDWHQSPPCFSFQSFFIWHQSSPCFSFHSFFICCQFCFIWPQSCLSMPILERKPPTMFFQNLAFCWHSSSVHSL